MPSAEWAAPVAEGPIDATVVLPGSKSLTNRYLVLAALGRDVSRLRRPLRSRDTRLMVGALQALGVDITDVDGTDWLITPGDLRGPASIDCGLAGNVMRFVPPLAGLALGEVHFDGDAHARRRPMAPILTALRAVGVSVEDTGSPALPFTIAGRGPSPAERSRLTPRHPVSSCRVCCSPRLATSAASRCITQASRSRACRTSR